MKGRRLPDGFDLTLPALAVLGLQTTPSGAYWKACDGTFYCCTPNGRFGWLAKHAIEEHDDQTITVSPSILVYAIAGATYTSEERARLADSHGEDQVKAWEAGEPAWHGFLERGIWREC